MTKKKLLFIESNTTGTGMMALKKAYSMNFIPILMTNKPDRYLGLEDTGCKIIVCDTNKICDIQNSINFEIRHQELAGILTTSEYYLETVAKLATIYNLPGNSIESMQICRDKSLTRKCLNQNSIGQPHFKIIDGQAQLQEAITEIGLPCIIKPVDESGSNNVLLCNSFAEAVEQVKLILQKTKNGRGQKTASTVLVEEFIDAPEFSVEMISWKGKHTVIGITEKFVTGRPYFVEEGHIFPALISNKIKKVIFETVKNALSVVGVKNGATHTEVKWTKDGCKIIEINARLAGGMIPELIRLVTDIDMIEEQVRCFTTGPSHFDLDIKRYAGIQFILSKKDEIIKEIIGIEEVSTSDGVENVTLDVEVGMQIHRPKSFSDRLGFVMVTGLTHDETKKRMVKAIRGIQINPLKERI
ncbi:ATP-grasp domain-containing protein [Bacillus pseudomycoides]|uniref:Arginase n=1 Tax=Bacillus pseudomycoides TaxID=64104 RepID=A0A2B5HMU2_9BACI|nr:ATP-grasp domain-containing protein [Bacillus pseudomycoides]PDY46828.1 arginase [Bacillus pseudomycoides]PEA82509.1 arginase [Bacillus pseudomycoides]PED71072.1 arginase [Bacillus pseudomycoides]PEI37955.1 arginase [Bacillus pseudomycoides]PEJ81846.1 arginase [Bacillus pseudomycoides]